MQLFYPALCYIFAVVAREGNAVYDNFTRILRTSPNDFVHLFSEFAA
jgi:hypothetical protein